MANHYCLFFVSEEMMMIGDVLGLQNIMAVHEEGLNELVPLPKPSSADIINVMKIDSITYSDTTERKNLSQISYLI